MADSSLVNLGFTPLEARVYEYLLAHGPATAYRVAKGIGASNANTYSAVQSLHRKGAICLNDGDQAIWLAVPSSELCDRLKNTFQASIEALEKELGDIGSQAADNRFYELAEPSQVLAKCRSMIRNAEKVLVLDLHPGAAKWLAASIRELLPGNVEVHVLIYEPLDLPGHVVVHPQGRELLQHWSAQCLSITADGREHLVAALGNDLNTVLQASWTRSPFFCYAMLSYAISQVQHTSLVNTINSADSVEEIRNSLAAWDHETRNIELPGLKRAIGNEWHGRKRS